MECCGTHALGAFFSNRERIEPRRKPSGGPCGRRKQSSQSSLGSRVKALPDLVAEPNDKVRELIDLFLVMVVQMKCRFTKTIRRKDSALHKHTLLDLDCDFEVLQGKNEVGLQAVKKRFCAVDIPGIIKMKDFAVDVHEG